MGAAFVEIWYRMQTVAAELVRISEDGSECEVLYQGASLTLPRSRTFPLNFAARHLYAATPERTLKSSSLSTPPSKEFEETLRRAAEAAWPTKK